MFSLGAGDHAFSILLPAPEGKVSPKRGELHFGCLRAKDFLAKISNLTLAEHNKMYLFPLIALDPSSEYTLTKSYFKKQSQKWN